MLILVLLIGCGVGLRNGLYASFQILPPNSVVVNSATTMLAYGGFESGRTWNITTSDIKEICNAYSSDIQHVAMLNLANNSTPVPVTYGNLVSNFTLAGEEPLTFVSVSQKLLKGRFINDLDIAQERNVCVIGDIVAEQMFGRENPLGKQIMVGDNIYTVVGIGKNNFDRINIGFDISEGVVIPFNLMQKSYNQGDAVHNIFFILKDDIDANAFISKLDPLIRKLHNIHPDDSYALRIYSIKAYLSQLSAVFDGFNFLIWIVGIGTLLAGLIGISNIMMITVNERTKEIGIRTVMGAQPFSIVSQIMCESLVISTMSGVLGICAGVGILDLISKVAVTESDIFEHPYIPFWTGVLSLLILSFGGLLASIIPAIKALRINPVEALSDK